MFQSKSYCFEYCYESTNDLPKNVIIMTECPPCSPKMLQGYIFKSIPSSSQQTTFSDCTNFGQFNLSSRRFYRRLPDIFWYFIQWIPSCVSGLGGQWKIFVDSIGWGMMPHASNFLFILFSYANNTLPFQNIFVPLVEE